jgi:hypothetical protein
MRRRRKGPSDAEIKLRSDLRRAHHEIDKVRKEGESQVGHPLAERVQELERIKERLSKLYFTQLDENRRRAARLHEILRVLSEINADRELETLVDRIARTIQDVLGFRIVLVRLREPGGARLQAVAFAGLGPSAQATLGRQAVDVDDFLSWLRPDFKVSHSFFISHRHPFSALLPDGYVPELGKREPWEWHAEDVLLVPLVDGQGELLGYFSVDDPVDRMVPSLETVELLEVFATHAVVAIENARLNRQITRRTRELEEADERMNEMEELKTRFRLDGLPRAPDSAHRHPRIHGHVAGHRCRLVAAGEAPGVPPGGRRGGSKAHSADRIRPRPQAFRRGQPESAPSARGSRRSGRGSRRCAAADGRGSRRGTQGG